jgi:hypothetical protein
LRSVHVDPGLIVVGSTTARHRDRAEGDKPNCPTLPSPRYP